MTSNDAGFDYSYFLIGGVTPVRVPHDSNRLTARRESAGPRRGAHSIRREASDIGASFDLALGAGTAAIWLSPFTAYGATSLRHTGERSCRSRYSTPRPALLEFACELP